MRVQIRKEETEERELVDRIRDDPRGAIPVLKRGQCPPLEEYLPHSRNNPREVGQGRHIPLETCASHAGKPLDDLQQGAQVAHHGEESHSRQPTDNPSATQHDTAFFHYQIVPQGESI